MKAPCRLLKQIKDPAFSVCPRGERGAAMVTALMFLLILTLLGMAAIMTSSTEMMIAGNDRLNKIALNYANAGAQAVIAKIDNNEIGGIGKAKNLDADSLNMEVTSTDMGISGVNFRVTVKYKKPDTLHTFSPYTSSSTVVGYCESFKYSKSPFKGMSSYNYALPVYEVTSEGWVGSESSPMAYAKVIVELTKNTINTQAKTGLLVGSCPTLTGQPTISGGNSAGVIVNNGGTACDSSETSGSSWDNVTSATAKTETLTSSNFVNFSSYLGVRIEDIPQLATQTPNLSGTETNKTFGSYPGDPQIIYVNNASEVTINGLNGYGILCFTGSLRLQGNVNWKGLIYCMGDFRLGGGGSQPIMIDGAIMVKGQTTTVNGANIIINYNQGILDEIAANGFNTKVINWRRIFN